MGRRAHISIGIDFAGPRAVAVEARGGGRVRLLEGALPSDAPVAAALPAYAGFLRRLTAPLPSIRKARRVLPSMLDIELPFPLEACSYVFLNVRRIAGAGVEALAVAARAEDIATWIERCRSAGVDPISIEHEAAVLWRAWRAERPLAREQTRLIVYLGVDRTTLAYGDAVGLVAATGLRQGVDALAEAGAPALQRLGLWWRAIQDNRAQGTVHIAWCGPAADRADARRALTHALFPDSAPRDLDAPDGERLLARALAQSLAAGESDEGNLRRGAMAHPLSARRAARARSRALAAAAAAALLLGGVSQIGLYALDRARDEWQARLVDEARRLSGADRLPRGQELFAAQRALERQAAAWAAFERYRGPGAEGLLSHAVRTAAGLGIHIQSAVVRPSSILMHGTAGDWDVGDRLAAALATRGLRANLDRRDAGADERVHFILRGEP
jgi:hypothetical protein